MQRIIAIILLLALPLSAACATKAQTGAATGALAGGLIGSLLTRNKVLGAAIGAGIGAGLGYIVGNEWDKYDQRQLSSTLETTPSGQTSTWVNPDTHATYQATPQPAYEKGGRVYRDVTIEATVDGKPETVHAKAYRNADGTWEMVQ